MRDWAKDKRWVYRQEEFDWRLTGIKLLFNTIPAFLVKNMQMI